MAIPDTRTDRPYHARMLAMADRLFTEFDHLPVSSVFAAIATATSAAKKHHHSPTPEPDQVERLAREQLRRNHGSGSVRADRLIADGRSTSRPRQPANDTRDTALC